MCRLMDLSSLFGIQLPTSRGEVLGLSLQENVLIRYLCTGKTLLNSFTSHKRLALAVAVFAGIFFHRKGN